MPLVTGVSSKLGCPRFDPWQPCFSWGHWRFTWLLTSGPRGISRDARKLARTPTEKKNRKKYINVNWLESWGCLAYGVQHRDYDLVWHCFAVGGIAFGSSVARITFGFAVRRINWVFGKLIFKSVVRTKNNFNGFSKP